MLQLLIDGQPLEVEGVQAEIDLSNTEFEQDVIIKAFKTQKINVPATPTNVQILTRLQQIGSAGYAPVIGTVSGGGVEVNGRVKLYPIERKANGWYYPVQIVSGNGDWVKELEAESLNTVNLSAMNHTLTRTNVINSATQAATGSIDYCYDVVDRGDGQRPGELLLLERFPAIRVSALFRQIFKDNGISVVSNTLTDGYMNRLFRLFTDANDLGTIDNYSNDRFELTGNPSDYVAGGTSPPQFGYVRIDYVAPGVVTFAQWNVKPVNVDVNDGDHYNPATGIYTVNANQAVATKFTASLRYKVTRTNWPGAGTFTVRLQLWRNRGGSYAKISEYSKASPSPTVFYTANIFTDWIRPVAGDQYFVRFLYDGTVPSGTTGAILACVLETPEAVTVQNNFTSYCYNWYITGETVDMATTLPDGVSKLDFIRQMAKDFDLMFDYQPDRRIMRVETRSRYFEPTYIDLDADIEDGDITVERAILDQGKRYLFHTLADSNDKAPGAIKLSEPFEVVMTNPYAFNTSDYDVPLGWADTKRMPQSRYGTANQLWPTMWGDAVKVVDGVQQFPKFRTEFAQRFMYLQGAASYSPGYIYDGATAYSYPDFRSVTASEVRTRYWTDRLWQINNASRLTVTVYMKGSTVNKLRCSTVGASLRTPVRVQIQGVADGVFMLEKVTGYRLDTPGLCELQLVELTPLPMATGGGLGQNMAINGDGDSLTINSDGDVLSLQVPGEVPIPEPVE